MWPSSTVGPEGTPPACGTSSGWYRRMCRVSNLESKRAWAVLLLILNYEIVLQVRLWKERLGGEHHLRLVWMVLWSTASWQLAVSPTGRRWWKSWGERRMHEETWCMKKPEITLQLWSRFYIRYCDNCLMFFLQSLKKYGKFHSWGGQRCKFHNLKKYSLFQYDSLTREKSERSCSHQHFMLILLQNS